MQDQSTKKCGDCKLEKPVSEFHRHKGQAGGYQWRCKECRRKFHLGAYAPVRPKQKIEGKRCYLCYEIKPFSEFYPLGPSVMAKRPSKDGFDFKCKKCCQKEVKRHREQRRLVQRTKVVEKACFTCKVVKPRSDFHVNKNKADWLNGSCKECVKAENLKAKPYLRKWHLKHKYKITEEYADAILESQNGRCGICERLISFNAKHLTIDQAYVDHDHSTGRVRGILCRRCNFMLSAVEQAGFVAKAKKYLKKYSYEFHPVQSGVLPNMVSDS